MYLLFVLLATVMWFTNAFSTRRTVSMTVPVTYIHMPDDYIFTQLPADRVRISLEDEGIDLFNNRRRSYALTFDLSEYIVGEEGTFVIPMDELRQAITQQLAGDATLAAFTPEVLSGSYTRQHEKVVPVIYTGRIQPAAQHQLCSEIKLTPDSVHIYGTEHDLADITHVETTLTDYEGVQDTFATRLTLIAPEGVRLKPDTVSLQVVAEQFTEKSLTLTVCTPDLSTQGQVLHLFPGQVTVTFHVGTAWFAGVQPDDITAFVDLPQAGNDRLPVQLECNNPHITHLRVKPIEVEYLIENYDTHSDGGSAASVPED